MTITNFVSVKSWSIDSSDNRDIIIELTDDIVVSIGSRSTFPSKWNAHSNATNDWCCTSNLTNFQFITFQKIKT